MRSLQGSCKILVKMQLLVRSCKEIFFLARFLQDVLQKNALSCKTLKENLARTLQGTHFFSTRVGINRNFGFKILQLHCIKQLISNPKKLKLTKTKNCHRAEFLGCFCISEDCLFVIIKPVFSSVST